MRRSTPAARRRVAWGKPYLVEDDRKRRCLLVQRSANRDGSAFSALLLADGLREAGWETHVAFGFEGPVIRRFREAGHQTEVVRHDNWLRSGKYRYFARNVLQELQAASRMASYIDRVQPDLVYVNTAVGAAGAVAARWRGVPSIWHIRELLADVGGELVVPSKLVGAVRQVFLRLPTRCVVNSRAVAENVLGGVRDGVHVVPNAVDEAFFEERRSKAEARRALGLYEEGPLVGVPSTLRPMKGHPFLLDAIAPLCADRPEVRVVVAGGGEPDYVDSLTVMADDFGVNGQIEFVGSVADMSAFYRACDVVVVPSVAEPFGRVVIEAMAVGVPVVATAVGGIPEIIDDGETGFLVEYGDASAIRRTIGEVLDRQNGVDQVEKHAEHVAKEQYHQHVYVERSLDIIHDVIASTSER